MTEGRLAELRRWLDHPLPEREAPLPAPAARPGSIDHEIDFSAYGEDCRIFGFVRLGAERLSDMLNNADHIPVESVLVVALSDNRALEAPQLTLQRSELIAVRGSGPRGNAARRTRTRPSPVAMGAGPYSIHGYLHSPPGGDAIQHFRRRETMVPVTEAWIEYDAGGARHRARVGPLIVNREFVDWIDRAKDTDVRLDLPVETRIDPRAKDMTGHVRVDQSEETPAT